MKQEATIVDIAQKAEVSTATVSRVLNGTGKVREKTKEKVEEAARELNYHPNIMAKNLSTEHSDVIGVLVSDVRNPFYANIFVQCEKYANENGFSLLLCNFLESQELELRYYDMLLAQRVCAIIHIGGSIDKCRMDTGFLERFAEISRRVPVVTSVKVEGNDSRCVKVDNERCTRKLMEFLFDMGHEKIALAGGRDNILSTFEKRKCYREMLLQKKIRYGDCFIAESSTYDEQGGYLAMRELFTKKKLPTAVIAINDASAVGVIRAIGEKGLEIGKDISVASFDNTYITELMEPELTSVSNDYYVLCRKIIDTAANMIGRKSCSDVLDIPITLSVRKSCGKI